MIALADIACSGIWQISFHARIEYQYTSVFDILCLPEQGPDIYMQNVCTELFSCLLVF
jgi:hypothetical protein